jgi:hypothetical protein
VKAIVGFLIRRSRRPKERKYCDTYQLAQVLAPDHFEFCDNVLESARMRAGQPPMSKRPCGPPLILNPLKGAVPHDPESGIRIILPEQGDPVDRQRRDFEQGKSLL